MVKKALRNLVKFIALIALIVFVFDNRLSGKSGLVLLGSIGILGICLVALLLLSLGEDWLPCHGKMIGLASVVIAL
jgi:hypothetical protein